RAAAGGLRVPREELRLRQWVRGALQLERLRPPDLHAVDHGDDAAVLALVGVGAGLAVLCQRGGHLLHTGAAGGLVEQVLQLGADGCTAAFAAAREGHDDDDQYPDQSATTAEGQTTT